MKQYTVKFFNKDAEPCTVSYDWDNSGVITVVDR